MYSRQRELTTSPVPSRTGGRDQSLGRRQSSPVPALADLAEANRRQEVLRLQRAVGNQSVLAVLTDAGLAPPSRLEPVVQRSGAAALRQLFNRAQAEEISKEELRSRIASEVIQFVSDNQLTHVWWVRERLDVLLSVLSDAMVVFAAGMHRRKKISWKPAGAAQSVKISREIALELLNLLPLKRAVVEVRTTCEDMYRQVMSSTAEPWDYQVRRWANALKSQWETVEQRWAAWTTAAGELFLTNADKNLLEQTDKTGKRETGDVSGTGQIDIRSEAIARTVLATGFRPHLVVGLPTAGAHIAARVASALNAVPRSWMQFLTGTPAVTTKLATFRPRYVKGSRDSPPSVEKALKGARDAVLERELKELLGDMKGRPVSVLIVDDFSSSGQSLTLARDTIAEKLTSLGMEPTIKIAVSRYTTAQTRDKLSADTEPVDNPIDYLVGSYTSGTREDVSAWYEQYQVRTRQSPEFNAGWNEDGVNALRILGWGGSWWPWSN